MGRWAIYLFLGWISLYSCSKKENEVQLPLGVWEKVTDFPGASHTNSVAFVLNDMSFVGTGGRSAKDFYAYKPSTNQWVRIADLPRGRFGAGIFAINDKIYVGNGSKGLGAEPRNYIYDWWEYNPLKDSWRVVAASPELRAVGISFSIDGVLGTGI